MNPEVYYCQVLSDDKKRALYDRYGEDGMKSAVGGQAGSYTVFISELPESAEKESRSTQITEKPVLVMYACSRL